MTPTSLLEPLSERGGGGGLGTRLSPHTHRPTHSLVPTHTEIPRLSQPCMLATLYKVVWSVRSLLLVPKPLYVLCVINEVNEMKQHQATILQH